MAAIAEARTLTPNARNTAATNSSAKAPLPAKISSTMLERCGEVGLIEVNVSYQTFVGINVVSETSDNLGIVCQPHDS